MKSAMNLTLVFDDEKEYLMRQTRFRNLFDGETDLNFDMHKRTGPDTWWTKVTQPTSVGYSHIYTTINSEYGAAGTSIISSVRQGMTTFSATHIDEAEIRRVSVPREHLESQYPRQSHTDHMRAHEEARREMANRRENVRREAQREADRIRLEEERNKPKTPWAKFRNMF